MLKTHELEKLFASDKSSPLFPVLANIYYEKKLYKYSVRVCRLGLIEDPHNLEGMYILSKTLLMQGKIEDAEIILKKILQKCPNHLHSSLLLMHIYEELKRNHNIIQAQIKKMYSFYPLHDKIIKYYEKYCAPLEISEETTNDYSYTQPKSMQFNYNAKLATITMYKLLYSQKEYQEALAILQILAMNPKHKKFANSEIEKINKKLDRS